MLTLSGELRQADYTNRRQDAITFGQVFVFSLSTRYPPSQSSRPPINYRCYCGPRGRGEDEKKLVNRYGVTKFQTDYGLEDQKVYQHDQQKQRPTRALSWKWLGTIRCLPENV